MDATELYSFLTIVKLKNTASRKVVKSSHCKFGTVLNFHRARLGWWLVQIPEAPGRSPPDLPEPQPALRLWRTRQSPLPCPSSVPASAEYSQCPRSGYTSHSWVHPPWRDASLLIFPPRSSCLLFISRGCLALNAENQAFRAWSWNTHGLPCWSLKFPYLDLRRRAKEI